MSAKRQLQTRGKVAASSLGEETLQHLTRLRVQRSSTRGQRKPTWQLLPRRVLSILYPKVISAELLATLVRKLAMNCRRQHAGQFGPSVRLHHAWAGGAELCRRLNRNILERCAYELLQSVRVLVSLLGPGFARLSRRPQWVVSALDNQPYRRNAPSLGTKVPNSPDPMSQNSLPTAPNGRPVVNG